MSEDQVVAVLMTRWNVSRETIARLRTFVELLLAENQHQNLIARSTEAGVWDRHILDSAQLLDFAKPTKGCWLDVGTGAGFPGLVLAILSRCEHILVEPRRRRADFLSSVVSGLGLSDRVEVVQQEVERVKRPACRVITARAVSSIEAVVTATRHFSDDSTAWLLHKGRSAAAEAAAARSVLCADVEMYPSMTDSEASIVKVTGLASRRA